MWCLSHGACFTSPSPSYLIEGMSVFLLLNVLGASSLFEARGLRYFFRDIMCTKSTNYLYAKGHGICVGACVCYPEPARADRKDVYASPGSWKKCCCLNPQNPTSLYLPYHKKQE